MTDIPLKAFGLLDDEHQVELEAARQAGKIIQRFTMGGWATKDPSLSFNDAITYRIAPEELREHQIDWSHCGPDVVAFATDKYGRNCGYFHERPRALIEIWHGEGGFVRAEVFASFVPGNKPWRDSLIVRPRHEGKT